MAVARNHGVTCRVFHDERSAGFYCVGYARGKGKAAGCIVTSGTAVANLLPAVVEASQQVICVCDSVCVCVSVCVLNVWNGGGEPPYCSLEASQQVMCV